MGNFMKAYTIAFESADGQRVTTRQIVPFFKKIETILSENPENVIRRINGKLMRVHAYEWNHMNEDFLVIPVGKLKEKNKPYGSDPKTQRLIDIPQDMYDVNSIAYHSRYKIALISSNSSGPNDSDLENYFNSYLPTDSPYKIRLTPIVRNIALDQIRNAHEARSITISLNIGRPMNDFLIDQVQVDQNIQGHLKHLKALMEFSKNTLDSNTFTLNLGLGKKRNASLDVNALLELLDSINLDASCIKEIIVNYRTGPGEKIDIAKLKENNAVLKIFFPIADTQLGAEYILNNMDDILRDERKRYYEQVECHFANSVSIGEDYEINTIWDERPVV